MDEGTDYVDRVLNNLIYLRRSHEGETEVFEDLKHNDDLCPRLDLQVDRVVSLFERFRKVVYDMQGLRDRGLDVAVRYALEEDRSESHRLIGFQVKSADDLKERAWLTTLKAQCWEAIGRPALKRLYVFVCASVRSKEQRAKVRDINAELAEHPKTAVVVPEYAHAFLFLGDTRMSAYLKRYFSKDDIVYREAVNSVESLTPCQTALLLQTIILAEEVSGESSLNRSDLLSSVALGHLYSGLPDLPSEFFFDDTNETSDWQEQGRSVNDRIQDDIESLDGRHLRLSMRNDRVSVLRGGLDALRALMLDGSVRYGYAGLHLMEYTLSTVQSEAMERISNWKRVVTEP